MERPDLDICDWLKDFLSAGPREASEVRAMARAAGYTRGEIKEGKQILQIKTTNNWTKTQPATVWYWSLP